MKRTIRSVVTAALAFVLALPLAAASPQAEWKGTLVKEGGVAVVRNPEEPLYNTPVLELREELSIGGPDAQGDVALDQGKYCALEEDEYGYQSVKRYAVTWKVEEGGQERHEEDGMSSNPRNTP